MPIEKLLKWLKSIFKLYLYVFKREKNAKINIIVCELNVFSIDSGLNWVNITHGFIELKVILLIIIFALIIALFLFLERKYKNLINFYKKKNT